MGVTQRSCPRGARFGASRRGFLTFVVVLPAVVALSLPASVSAMSASVSVSPAPAEGTPAHVTTVGTTEFTSTTLQLGVSVGSTCIPSLAVPFATHTGIPSPFSFTDTWVPPAQGTYCIFAALNGSGLGGASAATGSYSTGTTVTVGAPPPPPPPGSPGAPGGSSKGGSAGGGGSRGGSRAAGYCYVPHLHGRTLRGARHLLGVNHCRLGAVRVSENHASVGRGEIAELLVDGQSFRPGIRIPAATPVTIHLSYEIRHVPSLPPSRLHSS